MNYTINQLQIFLTIVEVKSITKAAEKLHLTQPAVSIQLKNLQKQFDIPLTEVVGRKIYITDFGKEIASAAQNIMNELLSINYRTLTHQGQLTGRLKFSIVSTGKYVMPYFLSDFINTYKGIELNIDVTNKERVKESLENNEVDFALVSILPNSPQIEKLDLLQNKLYLVGSNKLDFKKFKSPKELFTNLPLIFRERGSGTRQKMEAYLIANKISIYKKIELTSNEAVKQAVLANLGYSIMPIIGLKMELLNKDLFTIPVKGLPISTMWSLVWLKGKKHSPAAHAYLQYLDKERKNIVNNTFKWSEQYV